MLLLLLQFCIYIISFQYTYQLQKINYLLFIVTIDFTDLEQNNVQRGQITLKTEGYYLGRNLSRSGIIR